MRPRTNEEHIGIEIECYGKMERSRLRELLYTDNILVGKVHVGYDISVKTDRDDEHRYEVRLLCTNSDRHTIVNRVMELLREVRCKVNNTCSIHVHLDMRGKSKLRMRTIFFNLVKCSQLLFNLQNDSRRNNKYCVPNNYETFSDTIRNETGDNDRRRAINAHSYSRLSTLEIRLHHGSLDAEEVNDFIDLLIKIKNKRKRLENPVENITQLKKFVTRDSEIVGKMTTRFEQHAGVP